MTTWFERFPAPEIRRQEHLRHVDPRHLILAVKNAEITSDEYRDAMLWQCGDLVHAHLDALFVQRRGPKKPYVESKKKAWFGFPKLASIEQERHKNGGG